jgi:hypothetical protein
MVIATNNHPFWVAGDINAWVEAADLKPGMWLRTSGGTYVQITVTKHWTTKHQRVHNLTITNSHTYYVEAGDTPVLVHNAGCQLGAKFNVPRQGGVYTITMNDGAVYVGMSTRDIRGRINDSVTKSGHSVWKAGYREGDVANVTFSVLPGASRTNLRHIEQMQIDINAMLGRTLINTRNPELRMPWH